MIIHVKNSAKLRLLKRQILYQYINFFVRNSIKLPDEIDRIYHIHVRKSGGSSVNNAFWKLAGYDLDKARRKSILIGNGISIVRYSDKLINQGKYLYASAHFPIWQLDLKPNTFTFTILRNPYDRLVSLYKYYKWVEQVDPEVGYKLDPSYYVLKKQTKLLNKTFNEFLDNLSDKYLFGNLYMFDENLNVNKALQRIKTVNQVFFYPEIDYCIETLSKSLQLYNLRKTKRQRSFSKVNYDISFNEKEKAMNLLKLDFEFYNAVKKNNLY